MWKSKWVWVAALIVAIAVEAKFGVNSVLSWALWGASFLSLEWQFGALALLLATAVLAVFLGGWFTVATLFVVALWPLSSLDLGPVDHFFGDVARALATDPQNLHQVYYIFGWLHTGFFAAIAAILIATCWEYVPRRR